MVSLGFLERKSWGSYNECLVFNLITTVCDLKRIQLSTEKVTILDNEKYEPVLQTLKV